MGFYTHFAPGHCVRGIPIHIHQGERSPVPARRHEQVPRAAQDHVQTRSEQLPTEDQQEELDQGL